MTANLDFEAALDIAFTTSEQLESALRLVDQLTAELDAAVQAKTGGKVRVGLMTAAEFAKGTLRGVLASLRRPASEPKEPDFEGEVLQQVVVASAQDNGRRRLFEVEFSSSGYPVALHGPQDDASFTYYTDEDVRAGFLKAASHGLVGRKLSALAGS